MSPTSKSAVVSFALSALLVAAAAASVIPAKPQNLKMCPGQPSSFGFDCPVPGTAASVPILEVPGAIYTLTWEFDLTGPYSGLALVDVLLKSDSSCTGAADYSQTLASSTSARNGPASGFQMGYLNFAVTGAPANSCYYFVVRNSLDNTQSWSTKSIGLSTVKTQAASPKQAAREVARGVVPHRSPTAPGKGSLLGCCPGQDMSTLAFDCPVPNPISQAYGAAYTLSWQIPVPMSETLKSVNVYLVSDSPSQNIQLAAAAPANTTVNNGAYTVGFVDFAISGKNLPTGGQYYYVVANSDNSSQSWSTKTWGYITVIP